jgi:uncharacterized RDD family membrane protein YckC
VTYPGQPQQPQHHPYQQVPQPGYPQGAYGIPAQAYYGPPPVPVAPNGQPLAGFGARLGAYLIDALIFAAAVTSLIIPVMFAMIAWIGSQAQELETDPVTGEFVNSPDPALFVGPILLGYLALFVVAIGMNYVYHVELFPSRRGVTLGKRALGLSVIRLNDPSAPLTRGVVAKRWAMQFMVGGIVPFFNWIDGLWQLWDKPFQQCLHDKVAETVVVKVNR